MKILPVSRVSFNSQPKIDNYDMSFWYTLPEKKENHYLRNYAILTALSALTAVLVTLFNVGGKKQYPYSIAEISDLSKGLNKIKNNDKLVNSLKTDFIYPIKAHISGDKKMNFKSGLVITGQGENELNLINSALMEHFDELGIKTVNIEDTLKRIKDNEVLEKPLRRNELNKQVLKQVEKARQNFEKTGEFTVINLGNLEKLTDLKVVKSKNSKFEELISDLSSGDNQGVIWVGITDKQKAIILFLNYLSVLIKR